MKHIVEAATKRLRILSASAEKKFVQAVKTSGMKLVENKPNRELQYSVSNFSEKALQSAMKASKWEPQGKDLFPSSEGDYYVQNSNGEELAVFMITNSTCTLEFSGY